MPVASSSYLGRPCIASSSSLSVVVTKNGKTFRGGAGVSVLLGYVGMYSDVDVP
jgi:hypothetical protein